MRASNHLRFGTLAAALLLGCGGSGSTPDPTPAMDSGTPGPGGNDASTNPTGGGAGTCASPIELASAGTRAGSTVTYHGSTTGLANTLHPAPGCAMHDDSEAVVHYVVPAGTQAVRVTTTGSQFDTVLYARTTCGQAADTMDLSCNNDSNDHPPQSTIYLTTVAENDSVYIVVDGNADASTMGGASNGEFTLTVSEIPFAAQGNPCRPLPADGSTTARCDGALRCSEGGSADGTALCVPAQANGAMCDPTGFANTCGADATCATDPSPPDGTTPPPVCATPGTHAGAPCRMGNPQCDGAMVCGSGENPVCVRTMMAGQPCDPTGASNRCANGLNCAADGDAGGGTCR